MTAMKAAAPSGRVTGESPVMRGPADPAPSRNRVVLQWMTDGTYRVNSDEPIELFSVDENCSRDRVFQHAEDFVSYGSVDTILGTSALGFIGDQSRADAIAHAICDREPPGSR